MMDIMSDMIEGMVETMPDMVEAIVDTIPEITEDENIDPEIIMMVVSRYRHG